ncbi:MAG: hypothetical protein EBR71_08975, partial [Planctomycetes bacterium]|nr:hypothetical protein [Planctomycetota bacterium]
MTFEAHLDGWESRRLSTGRAVDAHEHATILSIGELFNRARLAVDTPAELSDLVRRHQNDPIGGLKALAPRMGVPPLELELYRRTWRDVMDAAFDRLLHERVQGMVSKGADAAKVQRFSQEVSSWRDRLVQSRAQRERVREERRHEESRRAAAAQREQQRAIAEQAKARAESLARMEAEARDRREREERQRSERQLRFDSLQQAYTAAVDRLKTELAAAEQ